MPQFHVEIHEQVSEVRTYKVEAETPLAAAREARERWIGKGEEPEDGSQIGVEERDYSVHDVDADCIEEFGEGEVAYDD